MRPAARKPAISSHSWRRDCGSSPVVGSSRKSSSGSPTRAHGERQSLLLPAGELPDPGVPLLLKLDLLAAPPPAGCRDRWKLRNSATVSNTVSFSEN